MNFSGEISNEKFEDIVSLHLKIFGKKMTPFFNRREKNNRYESDYPIFLVNYKAGKFLLEMHYQKITRCFGSALFLLKVNSKLFNK